MAHGTSNDVRDKGVVADRKPLRLSGGVETAMRRPQDEGVGRLGLGATHVQGGPRPYTEDFDTN